VGRRRRPRHLDRAGGRRLHRQLTGALPEVWLFALGALFILVTLFLPKGVVGLWGQIKARGSRKAATA
jgi:ABC-type branched-subunit amino acid transport system permease subunit